MSVCVKKVFSLCVASSLYVIQQPFSWSHDDDELMLNVLRCHLTY